MSPLFYVAIRCDAWVHRRRCWLPSRRLVTVIASSVVGILKAASRAFCFLLVPFYILPLVDCSVSPLGALPVIHLPTNCDGFINAVSLTQLPPASKTNTICVGLTSVPPPLISSILTSSVATVDLFHLEVHPLPSIKLLGNCCCRRMLSSSVIDTMPD